MIALAMQKESLVDAWTRPVALEREMGFLLAIADYLRGLEDTLAADLWATDQRGWQSARRRLRAAWFTSDPFLAVLLYAIRLADMIRNCPNPDCPAPYFIASRRAQRYCSGACALPAQWEFKRTRSAEHGSEWREKREPRQMLTPTEK